MEFLKLQVAKTTKKYDPEKLLTSFEKMKLEISPHRLDDAWFGWALKSMDGSIESGLWGYHVTEEMKEIYKTTGYHPDKNFAKPTSAYKYFDWILDEFPDSCRARIINTSKHCMEQLHHKDGKVYRLAIPIIPSNLPFLEVSGGDVITAYDVGALYIINGDEMHKPIISPKIDRYHLMFSSFDIGVEL